MEDDIKAGKSHTSLLSLLVPIHVSHALCVLYLSRQLVSPRVLPQELLQLHL